MKTLSFTEARLSNRYKDSSKQNPILQTVKKQAARLWTYLEEQSLKSMQIHDRISLAKEERHCRIGSRYPQNLM